MNWEFDIEKMKEGVECSPSLKIIHEASASMFDFPLHFLNRDRKRKEIRITINTMVSYGYFYYECLKYLNCKYDYSYRSLSRETQRTDLKEINRLKNRIDILWLRESKKYQ